MKGKISKKEAKIIIDSFFQRNEFSSDEVKKIKRLAMKFNIKLGNYRRFFCKGCSSKLSGKLRVSKVYRTTKCEKCGYLNRRIARNLNS